MSEETATATALEKPANSTAQFDIAAEKFEFNFPVPWANKDGFASVLHSLQRPSFEQESEYRSMIRTRQRQSGKKVTDEGSDAGAAIHWLWSQIAREIEYPGLPRTGDAQYLAKVKPTHKEMAINLLFACDASIDAENSETTFDSARWAVRLRIGVEAKPLAIIRLNFNEWGEKARLKFDKQSGQSSTEIQGKTQLRTSSVNQRAFTDLFSELLINASTDPKSPAEVIVKGRPIAEVPKEELLKWLLAEWQIEVIFQLTQFWSKSLSD